ncbi:MAG: hypothetical protein ACYDC5_04285 [Candidatus Dormibacteria bacterium]
MTATAVVGEMTRRREGTGWVCDWALGPNLGWAAQAAHDRSVLGAADRKLA